MFNTLYVYLPLPNDFFEMNILDFIATYFSDYPEFVTITRDRDTTSDNALKFPMYFDALQQSERVNFMVIAPTNFGSDPRSFIRFRINGENSFVANVLKELAQEQDGYYGDNSKEFTRPMTGQTLFCVGAGVTQIELSIGEVLSRIDKHVPGYRDAVNRPFEYEKIQTDFEEHCKRALILKDTKFYLPLLTEEVL